MWHFWTACFYPQRVIESIENLFVVSRFGQNINSECLPIIHGLWYTTCCLSQTSWKEIVVENWNVYKKGVIQFVNTPWPIHYALNSYDKLCNWCLISVTDCSIGIAAHFDENAVFENSLFKQSLTIEDAPRVGDNHYSLCFIRLTSFC